MGPRHGAESHGGDARTLPDRVLRGLRSPFPAVRAWACGKAGGGGIRVDPAVLLALLDDPSAEVLRAAAKAAGLLSMAPAVPRLIELLDASDPDLSLQAAWALESIGRAAAEPAAPKALAAPKAPILSDGDRREARDFRREDRAKRIEAPAAPRSISPLPGEAGFVDETGFLGEGVGLADLGTPTRVALALGLILAFVGGALTGRIVEEPREVLRFDDGRPAAAVVPSPGGAPIPVAEPWDGRFPVATRVPPAAASLWPVAEPAGTPGRGQADPGETAPRVAAPGPVRDAAGTGDSGAGDDPARRHAVWLSTAARYLASGRPREAVEVADRVLAEDPGSADAAQLKRLAAETYGVLE